MADTDPSFFCCGCAAQESAEQGTLARGHGQVGASDQIQAGGQDGSAHPECRRVYTWQVIQSVAISRLVALDASLESCCMLEFSSVNDEVSEYAQSMNGGKRARE